MAVRVFFSFHYQLDIWRVNQIRNSWVTKPDRETAGFFDASLWENARKTGDTGIKRMINDGVTGTSRTAVLIGSQTYRRRWVRYEIVKSLERLNPMLGILIHQLAERDGTTIVQGPNPFEYLAANISEDGNSAKMQEWDGTKWIEFADCPKINFPGPIQDGNRNKCLKLSSWYTLYDWVAQEGYKNFATWLG